MIQFGIELLIFSEIIPLTNLFSQSKMKGMDQVFFTWIYGSHLKCASHKSEQKKTRFCNLQYRLRKQA